MRLNLSLTTLGLGSSALLIQNIDGLTGKGFWTGLAAAGVTSIISIAQYALTSGHNYNIASIAQVRRHAIPTRVVVQFVLTFHDRSQTCSYASHADTMAINVGMKPCKPLCLGSHASPRLM